MPRKNIKVIKVPMSDDEKLSIYKPQIFPRLPRLYLELLENKIKIKQDLINKDYIPSDKKYDDEANFKYTKKYDDEVNDKYTKKHDDDGDKYTKKHDDDGDKYTKKHDDDGDKYTKKYDDDGDKYTKKYEDEGDKYTKKYDDDGDKYTKKYEDDGNKYTKKYDDDGDKYTKKYHDEDDKDDKKDDDFDSKLDDYISKNKEKDVEKSYSPSSNISDRLQQLLKDEPAKSSDTPFMKKSNNLNYRSVENYKRHDDENIPPTLSEIESQGGIKRKRELRDINNISRDEQEEEDLKRELMFKIDLLKKSYPNAMIPEFSIHSDYNTMKKTYDSTVRRLSLDSSVDNYKNYLIGGFMLCEFVLGSYMGFDMQGFTQQQILTMNSYEVLLIELGEKSYIPQGSKWPVEIRLIGLILINVVFFIVSKMIMKKTGSNLLGLINNMNVKNNNTNSAKRKMKGPNINLDEIPEIPVQ